MLLSEMTKPSRAKKKHNVNSILFLKQLCDKFYLELDLSNKEEVFKLKATYKKILERLLFSPEKLERIVKYYIVVGKADLFKKKSFSSLMFFNVFYLEKNLDFFIRASNILEEAVGPLDFINVRRLMEEKYGEFNRARNQGREMEESTRVRHFLSKSK